MVDREIFSRRLAALRGYSTKLRAFQRIDKVEFIGEAAIHHLAERYLHLALEAAREGHDPNKFLDHLIASYRKRKTRPRSVVTRRLRVFRRAARKGEAVAPPSYDNPCSRVAPYFGSRLLADR